MTEEADIVIVGGGTAGAVVAARLSENPQLRIVLIEAGGLDRNPWIHIPIGFARTFSNPRLNWAFESEPVTALGGRRTYWPAGRVLGGTSSINGMIYIRGNAADYDAWRDMGNPGWGYDEVLPLFRKSENQARGADRFHGVGGPLHVADQARPSAVSDAFIRAALEIGYQVNPDFNGASQDGVGYQQRTVRRGLRVSTATAFLRLARGRSNLRVLTDALVERIEISDGRATGVRFRRGSTSVTVRARQSVILCAGAVNTPKLLLLSGIGPGEQLAEFGIPVHHENPAVGEGLQDHFGAAIKLRLNRAVTTNDALRGPLGRFRAGLEWAFLRRGVLAIGSSEAALFTRSSVARGPAPDLKIAVSAFSADSPQAGLHPWPGATLIAAHLHPESRGCLRLGGPRPTDPPRIEPNYLSTVSDQKAILEALALCRRLTHSPAFADLIAEETLPGFACADADDLLAHARHSGGSLFHPVGTCAMGPEGVVDAQLRVHGVVGLSIADASVMPHIVSGNTMAATIMIAERLATMIEQNR